MELQINRWAADLYEPHGKLPIDYALIDGGRASSKTYEISQALVVKAVREPLRILVTREHLKSIRQSAHTELRRRAAALNLIGPDGFEVTETAIRHVNGGEFLFHGLSKMSEEDIKGLAYIDITWVEEAHMMSHSSWELLRPTVMRNPRAQIWSSWNPKYRTDAISEFMEKNLDDPRVWYRRVNWRDNAFLSDTMERERLRYKKENPERYPHIYEGEYDDVSDKRKVLPHSMVQMCVDAWHLRPQPRGAFIEAGYDVADTGTDKNALVLRSGPEIFMVDTWAGSQTFTLSDSARQVAKAMADNGADRLFYDGGGVGAGIRGPLIDNKVPFQHRAVQFGGKVDKPDVNYLRRSSGGSKTNAEYFSKWADQAGWILRLRAANTARLMAGEPVDPDNCLFIDPEMPGLRDLMKELSQPEWDDRTGKLKIEKQPHEPHQTPPPSPDMFDAARLAFGREAGMGARLMSPTMQGII